MSDLLIMRPLPIAAVTADGTGAASLLTPDPREVWSAPTGSPAQLTIDLGAAMAFDTVFLGYCNFDNSATIGLSVDGGATTTVPFVYPALVGRAKHGLIALAAPVVGRRLAVTVTMDTTNQIFRAGIAMVGLSFRPGWPQEWGGGRAVIDTGTRDRLQLGGFAIDPGVRKASWQWTLGDLSDDEVAALYAIVLDRGETNAVLVVEGGLQAPRLCERIHYGVFDKLEAWERRDAGLTRWALRVEDWL